MNSYLKLVLFTASLALATAFTISCSGDDGKDGASCVLAGNVLTCGETSYTIQKGEDGKGCSIDEGTDGVTLTCGNDKVIIPLCDGNIYDVKTQVCENGIVKTYFIDSRDNTKYKAVAIGNLIWMTENLNYAGEEDGEIGVCYGDEAAKCTKYGRLYDWATAQTACPAGWRLPSNAEWTALLAFAGSDAGKKLKSKEVDGTDDYGFSALLGGYKGLSEFSNESTIGRFWGNQKDSDYAYSFEISSNSAISREDIKTFLLSIRCVKQ
jgi:uncharacterized protein (TIGR02145 family)